MTTAGHCLCRKTGWEFEGEASWGCYCHCDDCRRNCAAPVVAWVGVPLENFKWRGKTPHAFESSPGVRRYFCGTCGSPLGFEASHYPGAMHVYAASLADPATFTPEFHLNNKSRLPWLKMDDDLPKHEGTLFQTSDEAGQGD